MPSLRQTKICFQNIYVKAGGRRPRTSQSRGFDLIGCDHDENPLVKTSRETHLRRLLVGAERPGTIHRHLSNQHIVLPAIDRVCVSLASSLRLVCSPTRRLVNSERINYVIINHIRMIYCVDYCLIKLKTIGSCALVVWLCSPFTVSPSTGDGGGERTHTKRESD